MNRLALRAALAALALLAPASLVAQTIGPPVAEYVDRAAGTFELTNSALDPVVVVMEPFSFRVDTLGNVAYLPFDTAAVKLKLSSTTVRIPPRTSFSVGYEATTRNSPAWFVVTSNFSAPRTPGLNLRVQLPHVVYLNQRAALERDAVKVHQVVHDVMSRKVRIKVENTSDRLGRCLETTVRAGNASVAGGAFPMFPRFWRWVEVEWPHAAPPESVRLEFERFTVDVRVADLASVRTASAAP